MEIRALGDRGEKRSSRGMRRAGERERDRERFARECLARKVERKNATRGLTIRTERRVDARRQREREERRRRWKEEAARPNMAAILCIPVVDGEVGKQARPQRQLSMPVISRNAPQRSEYFVFLIRAPR